MMDNFLIAFSIGVGVFGLAVLSLVFLEEFR